MVNSPYRFNFVSEGKTNTMKYCILRKRELFLTVGIFCTVLVFSLFGAQKVAVEVASDLRSLPIYCVETKNQEKKIALGINCAWGNEDIPSILDTLDDAGIKATFFMVGTWCDKYPDSVKLIAERGHEIGNHSDTHADMPSLSEAQIEEEIENCSQKIEKITGKKPDLFRCPSGSYNNLVVETAVRLGYYPIQWSVDSLDWKDLKPAEMEERILPNLTYGDILLFHNDTDYTARALPELIAKIQDKGYTFVTVGELIHRGDYTVDVTGRQFEK